MLVNTSGSSAGGYHHEFEILSRVEFNVEGLRLMSRGERNIVGRGGNNKPHVKSTKTAGI